MNPTQQPGSLPDYVVSVAAVISVDSDRIPAASSEFIAFLAARYRYYELALIDNRPAHKRMTALSGMIASIPSLRIVTLSRSVAQDVALTAALEHVIGDFVVAIDLLSDPPEAVERTLAELTSGNDVVVGCLSEYHGSRLRGALSRMALKMVSAGIGVELDSRTGSCLGFTRRAVNAITRIRSKAPLIIYNSALVGFRRVSFEYSKRYPSGVHPTQSSFSQSVGRYVRMIVAHSMLPLRLASLLGLVTSFLNLLYMLYVVAVAIFKSRVAEGWVTLSLTHTAMFLILFLILAVMTEYIARLMDESRDIPLYFVENEVSSTVSSWDRDRVNVVSVTR
jgi:polyisoprenyl-phosphate glycosyltransferase